MSGFDDLVVALNEGEIVALARGQDGSIEFVGSFADDNEAALLFSADSPEKLEELKEKSIIFIKDIHELHPRNLL